MPTPVRLSPLPGAAAHSQDLTRELVHVGTAVGQSLSRDDLTKGHWHCPLPAGLQDESGGLGTSTTFPFPSVYFSWVPPVAHAQPPGAGLEGHGSHFPEKGNQEGSRGPAFFSMCSSSGSFIPINFCWVLLLPDISPGNCCIFQVSQGWLGMRGPEQILPLPRAITRPFTAVSLGK